LGIEYDITKQKALILLNIISNNYDLMFRSINANRNTEQLTVFDPASRASKDAGNMRRTMRRNNKEVELFKLISYSNEGSLLTNRETLVHEELLKRMHLSALLSSEQAIK
jgi:hypothetical protein